jgi:hypothetical protein
MMEEVGRQNTEGPFDAGCSNLTATTKARKLENAKKGNGVHETLFFRPFAVSLYPVKLREHHFKGVFS